MSHYIHLLLLLWNPKIKGRSERHSVLSYSVFTSIKEELVNQEGALKLPSHSNPSIHLSKSLVLTSSHSFRSACHIGFSCASSKGILDLEQKAAFVLVNFQFYNLPGTHWPQTKLPYPVSSLLFAPWKPKSAECTSPRSLTDDWAGRVQGHGDWSCVAKKMYRGQIWEETGNSFPDEMRGDYSQSGLCCSHIVSTIKSEMGWEELVALQMDSLNYSPGFTSVVFKINHWTSWCQISLSVK